MKTNHTFQVFVVLLLLTAYFPLHSQKSVKVRSTATARSQSPSMLRSSNTQSTVKQQTTDPRDKAVEKAIKRKNLISK